MAEAVPATPAVCASCGATIERNTDNPAAASASALDPSPTTAHTDGTTGTPVFDSKHVDSMLKQPRVDLKHKDAPPPSVVFSWIERIMPGGHHSGVSILSFVIRPDDAIVIVGITRTFYVDDYEEYKTIKSHFEHLRQHPGLRNATIVPLIPTDEPTYWIERFEVNLISKHFQPVQHFRYIAGSPGVGTSLNYRQEGVSLATDALAHGCVHVSKDVVADDMKQVEVNVQAFADQLKEIHIVDTNRIGHVSKIKQVKTIAFSGKDMGDELGIGFALGLYWSKCYSLLQNRYRLDAFISSQQTLGTRVV